MNFLERYKEFLGDEYKNFEDFLEYKPKKSIRINTIKIQPKEILERLKNKGVELKKIPWLDYGYEIVKSEFSLGSCPEYLQGYFFIQESAAQLPVQILDPSSHDIIMDCCASPGAKTTQIAQLMHNKGKLIATDFKESRLFALRNNLERCGVKNTLVYEYDARKLENLDIEFDKILVDAPCSGNFIQEKDWFKKRTLSGIRKNTEKQKAILDSALNCLKSK